MKAFGLSALALGLTACAESPVSTPAIDNIITLSASDNRPIQVRYISPPNCEACPLIIFSHGANATFERYDSILKPLSQAGYRIAAPNHTDSEGHAQRSDYGPPQWMPTRLEDYNVIAKHYNADITIAAGHSFGALIAQIAGGAKPLTGQDIDSAFRPHAVIAYSPPGPISGFINSEGWSKVSSRSLVVTGTQDIVPKMTEEWSLHLASFEAAPKGTSYALIYDDMDHYMNGSYGRETVEDTPERQRAIEHLIKSTVLFMSKTTDKKNLSAQNWMSLSDTFVETRVN